MLKDTICFVEMMWYEAVLYGMLNCEEEMGGVFVTLWFSVTFLCAVQRRRGVMLGTERLRPSDACCFVF